MVSMHVTAMQSKWLYSPCRQCEVSLAGWQSWPCPFAIPLKMSSRCSHVRVVVKRDGDRDRDRDNSSDRDSGVDNNHDSDGYLGREWWSEQESAAEEVRGHVRGGYSENGVGWKKRQERC